MTKLGIRAILIPVTGIVTDIEAGMVFTGKVVRIMNFGAFVQLAPNKDGMVHISKLSDKRVAKVEDVVNIGDEVTVKVAEVDKMGRINLTMRPSDLAEKKEEKEEKEVFQDWDKTASETVEVSKEAEDAEEAPTEAEEETPADDESEAEAEEETEVEETKTEE